METQRFCVYNLAKESFLSFEVTVVFTAGVTLRKLIESIIALPNGIGIWFRPYRGIPAVPGIPSFDLIYLDNELRVVQEVESYHLSGAGPLKAQVTSALALPVHTILASQTRPGDQLAICTSEEMEHRLEAIAQRAIESPAATGRSTDAAPDHAANIAALTSSDEQTKRLHRTVQQLNKTKSEANNLQEDSWKSRFAHWAFGNHPDRRKARRYALPGLVAFYWTGDAPHADHVGTISETGLYLLTDDRPIIGSMMLMTLQENKTDREHFGDSIAVLAKVVRWGVDGIGMSFITPQTDAVKSNATAGRVGANQKALEGFILHLNLQRRSE